MGNSGPNNGPGGKPLNDVRIYGAAIWSLRQLKKPWKAICQQLELADTTAKRYLSQYLDLIKDDPKIRDAMAQATQDLTDLVGPSVKKYSRLIRAEHVSPAMEGIAVSCARDVLKTNNLVQDKKIVEASIISIDDDELESEYADLVRRRREANRRSSD